MAIGELEDTEQRFIEAVAAEPAHDEPRLAYAAWLNNQGDPRGEFIEAQCALARLPASSAESLALAARAEALEKKYSKKWLTILRSQVGASDLYVVRYERGFATEVAVGLPTFLATSERLFRSAPVEEMSFGDLKPEGLKALAQQPLLARLRKLDLGFNYRDEHAKPIKSTGARALFSTPHLSSLRELDVSGQQIGDVGAHALAECALPKLEVLNVGHNAIGAAGARSLAQSSGACGSLRCLGLVSNPIGDDGMARLAEGVLRALVTLDVIDCAVTAAGVRALAASQTMGSLEALNLTSNPCGDDGVAALAASTTLTSLRCLRINNAGIGPTGARTLEQSRLSRLSEVFLTGNAIGEEAATALSSRFSGVITPF